MSAKILKNLGVDRKKIAGGNLIVRSPIDGAKLGALKQATPAQMKKVAENAQIAFDEWREVPAPVRGEFIRLFGEEMRAAKENLGKLVTLESGKIYSEGLGEVQEIIDICDYAVGLSRQLYGLTIASERPGHHMREVWQPLGPVAIISAFNFPVAVWAWNAALAIVCGDSVVWKPSEKTPITALACQALFDRAAEKFRKAGHKIPKNLSQAVIGGREVGEALANDRTYPLVSATGSTRMGKEVSQTVAARLGKSLLELGGNNAMIVTPTADLDLALTRAYKQIRIGNPLQSKTLVGPLIDEAAYKGMESALEAAKKEGGRVLVGGKRTGSKKGFYVEPSIILMPKQSKIVQHETFAPILYVLKYKTLAQAIKMHNAVPQGLSSCIFTGEVREAERFTSATGSDCGIANVNIGPSGAEIGGAFGGEKDTGGGRESGSDSWRAYMRRQTQTVNYSDALPLAQGVVFNL
jgi:aldehyde dehydrogenase (NAD+)